jgi:hypothetical protein
VSCAIIEVMVMDIAWGMALSPIPDAVAGMDVVASMNHANSIITLVKREERMRCMANAQNMRASISPPKTMLNDPGDIVTRSSIRPAIDSCAGQDFR